MWVEGNDHYLLCCYFCHLGIFKKYHISKHSFLHIGDKSEKVRSQMFQLTAELNT